MQNSTSAPQNPLIGITHGDFNGTSYEIVLKAYADLRLLFEAMCITSLCN